jgi:hypothetical protein
MRDLGLRTRRANLLYYRPRIQAERPFCRLTTGGGT